MRLSRDWQIIIRFALVGFALGLVSAGGDLVADTAAPAGADLRFTAVIFLLCPGALVAMPFSPMLFEAAEVGTSGFYLLWLMIAVINAVLYLLAGAAYVGLRKKPDGRAAT